MIKNFLLISILFSFIFSQTENNKIQIQESSVFWKKDLDKLVLKDGEVFYGEFIETRNENIFFKVEFVDEVNIFKISKIRHLVLANGKNIIRNNRDYSLACSFIWLFISIYFSQFHNSIR
tara:strand:- start:276 stop:635 length:360 start_codon:yes stop_codon:yes gene_type:complete